LAEQVIEIKHLHVGYHTPDGSVAAVRDVSFSIAPSELLGLVGESGSGKTTIALAMMNYLSPNSRVSGEVLYRGTDITRVRGRQLRELRGGRIAMVYQDPMSSLNPAIPVGEQIAEALWSHRRVSRRDARKRAVEMMHRMHIADPEVNARRYVHQLSGGMQQRVVIAMAMICDPDLLILDEPTTALDVTTEATILDLIAELKASVQTAILFITHDLGVIARVSDRVGVMYAGELVELSTTTDLFSRPQHPYTVALLKATPHGDPPAWQSRRDEPLLEARDVMVGFVERSWLDGLFRRPPVVVRAVDGISLQLRRNESLGLVGESGSGKTTLGKALAGILPVTSGEVRVNGSRWRDLSGSQLRDARRRVQFIFQNPEASLNPRKTVRQLLRRPLVLYGRVSGKDVDTRVMELLELVQLRSVHADRFPHELSGGEKQRVAIARAFAADPDIIIADEPLSALDVSIQAAILQLLANLKERFGTAYLFISHDLNVVRSVCDRVLVMYLGNVYESGAVEHVFVPPQHPYTEALLSAVPGPDPLVHQPRIRLEGAVPSPRYPPSGCKFHTRCPRIWGDICRQQMPPPQNVRDDHLIYCHRPLETLMTTGKARSESGGS
jgi:peptide/nickel transport system ATP-binding protein